jgi:hypothetical protein
MVAGRHSDCCGRLTMFSGPIDPPMEVIVKGATYWVMVSSKRGFGGCTAGAPSAPAALPPAASCACSTHVTCNISDHMARVRAKQGAGRNNTQCSTYQLINPHTCRLTGAAAAPKCRSCKLHTHLHCFHLHAPYATGSTRGPISYVHLPNRAATADGTTSTVQGFPAVM